jgi:hypothetical protein
MCLLYALHAEMYQFVAPSSWTINRRFRNYWREQMHILQSRKVKSSTGISFESSDVFCRLDPFTVHLDRHLLKAIIIKFMASWSSSSNTEKLAENRTKPSLNSTANKKQAVAWPLSRQRLQKRYCRPPANKRQAVSPPLGFQQQTTSLRSVLLGYLHTRVNFLPFRCRSTSILLICFPLQSRVVTIGLCTSYLNNQWLHGFLMILTVNFYYFLKQR